MEEEGSLERSMGPVGFACEPDVSGGPADVDGTADCSRLESSLMPPAALSYKSSDDVKPALKRPFEAAFGSPATDPLLATTWAKDAERTRRIIDLPMHSAPSSDAAGVAMAAASRPDCCARTPPLTCPTEVVPPAAVLSISAGWHRPRSSKAGRTATAGKAVEGGVRGLQQLRQLLEATSPATSMKGNGEQHSGLYFGELKSLMVESGGGSGISPHTGNDTRRNDGPADHREQEVSDLLSQLRCQREGRDAQNELIAAVSARPTICERLGDAAEAMSKMAGGECGASPASPATSEREPVTGAGDGYGASSSIPGDGSKTMQGITEVPQQARHKGKALLARTLVEAALILTRNDANGSSSCQNGASETETATTFDRRGVSTNFEGRNTAGGGRTQRVGAIGGVVGPVVPAVAEAGPSGSGQSQRASQGGRGSGQGGGAGAAKGVGNWVQAMHLQAIGACRGDDRLRPLLRWNLSCFGSDGRLLVDFGQHFRAKELAMLVRCLLAPLVSIRVGKVARFGRHLTPLATRGSLSLVMLPESDLRLYFVADAGPLERVAILTGGSEAGGVKLETLSADTSARTFSLRMASGRRAYFWQSEKCKAYGDELLEKLKELLARPPTLSELTGIQESRLNGFARFLRTILLSTPQTPPQAPMSAPPPGVNLLQSMSFGLPPSSSSSSSPACISTPTEPARLLPTPPNNQAAVPRRPLPLRTFGTNAPDSTARLARMPARGPLPWTPSAAPAQQHTTPSPSSQPLLGAARGRSHTQVCGSNSAGALEDAKRRQGQAPVPTRPLSRDTGMAPSTLREEAVIVGMQQQRRRADSLGVVGAAGADEGLWPEPRAPACRAPATGLKPGSSGGRIRYERAARMISATAALPSIEPVLAGAADFSSSPSACTRPDQQQQHQQQQPEKSPLQPDSEGCASGTSALHPPFWSGIFAPRRQGYYYHRNSDASPPPPPPLDPMSRNPLVPQMPYAPRLAPPPLPRQTNLHGKKRSSLLCRDPSRCTSRAHQFTSLCAQAQPRIGDFPRLGGARDDRSVPLPALPFPRLGTSPPRYLTNNGTALLGRGSLTQRASWVPEIHRSLFASSSSSGIAAVAPLRCPCGPSPSDLPMPMELGRRGGSLKRNSSTTRLRQQQEPQSDSKPADVPSSDRPGQLAFSSGGEAKAGRLCEVVVRDGTGGRCDVEWRTQQQQGIEELKKERHRIGSYKGSGLRELILFGPGEEGQEDRVISRPLHLAGGAVGLAMKDNHGSGGQTLAGPSSQKSDHSFGLGNRGAGVGCLEDHFIPENEDTGCIEDLGLAVASARERIKGIVRRHLDDMPPHADMCMNSQCEDEVADMDRERDSPTTLCVRPVASPHDKSDRSSGLF